MLVLPMREDFIHIPAVDPLAANVALDEVGAVVLVGPFIVVILHA